MVSEVSLKCCSAHPACCVWVWVERQDPIPYMCRPCSVYTIHTLCRSITKDFSGELGSFTPCFTDVVVLGMSVIMGCAWCVCVHGVFVYTCKHT